MLDIDAWEHHLRRIEQSPRNSPSWFRLVQTEDDERFDHVLALAERLLPLDELGTGAAEETGLSPEFDVHDTLLVLVNGLVDKPGVGLNLVDVALRSPVVRVRRGALRVLAAWADKASPEARALLVAAEPIEPDEELAADMRKVLAGQRLTD